MHILRPYPLFFDLENIYGKCVQLKKTSAKNNEKYIWRKGEAGGKKRVKPWAKWT